MQTFLSMLSSVTEDFTCKTWKEKNGSGEMKRLIDGSKTKDITKYKPQQQK